LRELARVEGVVDSVWFSGVRDDVAAAMAGLDVFALPSLAEGISNTLLEAMSCARPCIATAVGGNVELIEDGRTGSLIPAADEEALDRAVLKYLRDTELARRHGEMARVTVKQRFSIERMVAEYAAIYESVAKRRLRRAAATKQATLETGTGH
jgi:glycosyltransferase involved in cell wall biosynthesis